jgi:DNA-binding SARP family transcriptional activator
VTRSGGSPEIYELNRGRRQPDGRELKQAHWIYPGWTLLLPPDAVGVPRRGGGREGQPEAAPSPRGGGGPSPTTTTTAATTTEGNSTGPSGLPVPGGGDGSASPSTRGGGGPAPTAPPPPSTDEPPRTTATPPTTQPPRTTAAPETTGEVPETTASAPPDDQLSSNLLRGAGMLAAGVLALLAILRVVQQRRRRSGRRIAMPDQQLAPVETRLRASATPDTSERADLALRMMAVALRRTGMESPEVMGVLVGPEMLEILLAAETPAAPQPFVLSYSRRRWGLPVAIPIERLRQEAASAAAPVPALVTLGTTQNGVLLLNLESPGLTALGGDRTAARAVLASFAVELATCGWADFIELILVGFGAELRRLERARVAASVKEVLPWLERKADGVVDLLGETEARSVLAGRVASDTPDAWVPAVVLCAERPSPEEVTRLIALTAVPSRSPVAAVVAAEDVAGARYTLRVPEEPGEPVHLPMFRLDVVPQRLDTAEYEGVAGLFETTTRDDVPAAARAEGAEAGEGERPRALRLHELRLSVRGEVPGVDLDEEPDIEVRVLGRIEIGGIERVERGKSEELVVFLALHPDGVDGDQLAEALWPGRPPARGTLNTTTAVARAYLGMTADGEPRLPEARNGIYRLDPSVGLDWARFQALAERGYAAGEGGVEDLRRALELVRGRPFEGVKPRSYGWAQLDQVPVMESAIVDAADHLAELLLRGRDHAGAQWAARQGIAGAPYDERLYRRLMLAADAVGNPAGVESAMDELLLRLEEENVEPYDTLHEETRALYERLTRHRRASHPSSNAG